MILIVGGRLLPAGRPAHGDGAGPVRPGQAPPGGEPGAAEAAAQHARHHRRRHGQGGAAPAGCDSGGRRPPPGAESGHTGPPGGHRLSRLRRLPKHRHPPARRKSPPAANQVMKKGARR